MNKINFTKLPSLTVKDAEFLREMESRQKYAVRCYLEGIEQALTERLQIHLGRVPSAAEIRQHASCFTHPDGARCFSWDGIVILQVAPIFTGIQPELN